MARQNYAKSDIQENQWLYEIDFRGEDCSQDLVKFNMKEIKELAKLVRDDAFLNENAQNFGDAAAEELDERYIDLELQLGTLRELEECGEDYVLDQYGQTEDDICEEIKYVYDQLFSLFDAKLDVNGKIVKFCWAKQ